MLWFDLDEVRGKFQYPQWVVGGCNPCAKGSGCEGKVVSVPSMGRRWLQHLGRKIWRWAFTVSVPSMGRRWLQPCPVDAPSAPRAVSVPSMGRRWLQPDKGGCWGAMHLFQYPQWVVGGCNKRVRAWMDARARVSVPSMGRRWLQQRSSLWEVLN